MLFPGNTRHARTARRTVRVFSPLRDECLPPETDIVYLGCGSPHQYAGALAENHCMLMALKQHVCSGRRIYAEGGGLAYLCQHVESTDGQRTPMVGALRAIARRNVVRSRPEPVELTLATDSWLGLTGTQLRGYRNTNWLLEPTGCLTHFALEKSCEFDLIGRHQAIGSRLHLNFAAQPNLLGGFCAHCPPHLRGAGVEAETFQNPLPLGEGRVMGTAKRTLGTLTPTLSQRGREYPFTPAPPAGRHKVAKSGFAL